jgi:hypothetical protein
MGLNDFCVRAAQGMFETISITKAALQIALGMPSESDVRRGIVPDMRPGCGTQRRLD